ncbi:phosphatidate cytidylyltransferase (plasmid) [Pedobacter sp. BS3]|uniref:phosphatidate cytidylyltransferase n=1 Tax=Pedobacter sp. BS3 TaxID=2567937 RepID=UPI0011EFF55B|nr:phosphatidate cytidylyltransferase [Pedobacter sp. BS3]TZF86118.1 phosphatidate cytidylyltransferase [Pedobacter sp. BS3]
MNLLTKSYLAIAVLAVCLLSSCEVIGGIFKAGFYTALIGVVIVIAIIIWIVSALRKRE